VRLYQCIAKADGQKKDADALSAADNAVAALGQICIHQHLALGGNLDRAWHDYLSHLPLKVDEAEGQRLHTELMDLAKAHNPLVLGRDGGNIGRLVTIFVSIYKTCQSTAELNKDIQLLIKNIGQERLASLGQQLGKKQQQKLEKIWSDANKPSISV